nr:hypothetical protein [Tanacetum cinerariifolium]
MMASFFQMNTASTSGLGPLPSNTIANLKGELKAITTRIGLVLDGPSIPMPPLFINLEEDERTEETLTDPELAEYTIKVPPPLVQKAKPHSLRNYVVRQRDPRHPHILYPSRMNQEKQQEKDESQMFKALLSNKEKLLKLVNTPLNENFSAVILKKLPEKLGDPGKFLISCGFSLLELISTSMTLELANRAICTPAVIARDVFVSVGKFTFPTDFVIVDYESDPRVPLILGRPFLRTARALIGVYGEEMILRDGDERLTLNIRHDTSSYSNQPHKESINMINIYNDSYEDYLKDLFATNHLSDDVDDDLVELESDNDDVYDDPFDSKEDKIKESKLLIDELYPPISSDYLPSPECDSVLYEDFSEVDALPLTNNENKVYNLGILIYESLFKVSNRVTPDKNVKKISIPNASLILEDFNPPLYELSFHKEVPGSETLLSFSSKNEENVFNPWILTSKGVHTSFLPKLSHRTLKISGCYNLKSLDPDYSSKNHVRKFLRALPYKWKAKVTTIKEAKDLATLSFDELIGNLKVYETILTSDGVAFKPIKEKVFLMTLKANVTRDQTSNDSVCQDGSDEEEEFNSIVRKLWKLFKKGNRLERENRYGNNGDKFDRGRGRRSKASSKRTKTRNFEREPQVTVEVRVALEATKWVKTLTNMPPSEPLCIICIQPPSGSKHSPTCPCQLEDFVSRTWQRRRAKNHPFGEREKF